MTPKEKARELIDKYSIRVIVFFKEDSIPRFVNAYMIDESAKQCALIAADEIMSALEKNGSWNYDYWEEVKKELEAL